MPSNLLVPITYQLADIFKITLQITDLYEMFNLCNVLSLACFNLLLNITIILFPFHELGDKLTEKWNGLLSVMQIVSCEAELWNGHCPVAVLWLMLLNTLLCGRSTPPVHPHPQHTYTCSPLFKIWLYLVSLVTLCLCFVERCQNYYISEISFINSLVRDLHCWGAENSISFIGHWIH